MDIDDLKEIISLLKDTDIAELQVEKDGTKIKLRRHALISPFEVQHKPAIIVEKTNHPDEESQGLVTVTAPIVGTFYRSPSPDTSPFVDTGAKVKKGQVLCIIEAMKLMNEIESEVDGIVVRSLVENGQPVEYGEPLFMIEPVE
ncbi:MAG: acetyl-CoA carboxylase biotin carboxyl carrier protein [Nitrospirota bacterium]